MDTRAAAPAMDASAGVSPPLSAASMPMASRESGNSLTAAIDRWIYVFMAGLFVLTTLVGFIPDSIGKVAAIEAGQHPPFPAVLHLHAVLMGAWLLLLLAQTTLVATGRRELHRELGMVSLVLAPAIVLAGFVLVRTMFHLNWTMFQSPPPGMDAAAVEVGKKFVSSLLLAQINVGILFSIFVAWALLVRRKDPAMHKRLLILATVLPLPAGIDRMGWLPTTYPESTLSPILYTLLWIAPMFLWDLIRQGRVHRAYIAWLGLYLPSATLVAQLWWSPCGIEAAQRLMDVSN